jgi:hypothetical protein
MSGNWHKVTGCTHNLTTPTGRLDLVTHGLSPVTQYITILLFGWKHHNWLSLWMKIIVFIHPFQILYIVKDVGSLPWIHPVIQPDGHLIHHAVLLFSACCSLSPMSPRGISSIPSSFYFLPARSPPCLRVDPSTDLGLQGLYRRKGKAWVDTRYNPKRAGSTEFN